MVRAVSGVTTPHPSLPMVREVACMVRERGVYVQERYMFIIVNCGESTNVVWGKNQISRGSGNGTMLM